MSDEELARFLQAEDEAAERQQRAQRRQAEEAAFEQFQREQGTCALCHTTVGTELILELSECGHRLCADCLRAHLQQWSASGSPTCPSNAGRCGVVVPERVMRQVLTSEQLGELQERQMKAFLSASASSYVHCPSCDVAFEAIASAASAPASAASTPRGSMAGGGSRETTEDGRELTAEQVEHRNRHRFRCVSCSANFCRLCQTTPYHLGYTCEEYQRYTTAPHCRYCEDVLLDQTPTVPAAAAAASAPSPPSATSFVARILRSNSKKEDLAPLPVAPRVPLNVCAKAECREKYTGQCIKLLPGCRHPCDGIRGERHCLPCLHDGCERHRADGPTRDEFCNICYSETLAQAPCVQLKCGHTFHLACVKTKLEKRWPTPRVTFHFMSCPLCNAQIEHPALLPTLSPLLQLRAQVQQKANDRLTFEGNQNDAPLQRGGKYEGRPSEYAMDLYAYYVCHKCHTPYFGGRRQCEEAAAAGARGEEAYNEAELVCGGCVLTEGGGNGCAKHGKEFIEDKCKWCCNIATWFCWSQPPPPLTPPRSAHNTPSQRHPRVADLTSPLCPRSHCLLCARLQGQHSLLRRLPQAPGAGRVSDAQEGGGAAAVRGRQVPARRQAPAQRNGVRARLRHLPTAAGLLSRSLRCAARALLSCFHKPVYHIGWRFVRCCRCSITHCIGRAAPRLLSSLISYKHHNLSSVLSIQAASRRLKVHKY